MRDAHQARIRAVSEQLAARPPGSRITIRKTTPSHSIRDSRYKSGCHSIDVSPLNEVLGIDTARRLATVEGQVTVGQLARATLAEGLLPAVVPEFRQFTVSGLINGEGIQSSSHRYGTFTRTLESVEVVLADGSVVNTSAASHANLFEAMPESLGTLGIVTAATVRLVPAGPLVKTTCRAFSTIEDYLAAFRATLGTCAFHEGVIFSPRLHVLITGDFVADGAATVTLRPDERGAPYFYQYVRRAAAARDATEDVLETLSYLSRSERGMWWMAECHADFPLMTETTWGRRLLDDRVAESYSRNGLASDDLPALERDRCVINQDMGVALQRLGEGIAWVQERLGVYPIWNCAVGLPDPGYVPGETSYVVDIGIYGEPTVSGYRHIRDMRALQKMADAPSLWGVSYLAWDELRATNPRRYDAYERARGEAGAAEAFLHIRDKVVWVDGSQPDEGKIPMWRLRRSFGKRWYLNPLVYPLLATVFVSKAIWRRQLAG
jgi:delta24-sterol reductase